MNQLQLIKQASQFLSEFIELNQIGKHEVASYNTVSKDDVIASVVRFALKEGNYAQEMRDKLDKVFDYIQMLETENEFLKSQ